MMKMKMTRHLVLFYNNLSDYNDEDEDKDNQAPCIVFPAL